MRAKAKYHESTGNITLSISGDGKVVDLEFVSIATFTAFVGTLANEARRCNDLDRKAKLARKKDMRRG